MAQFTRFLCILPPPPQKQHNALCFLFSQHEGRELIFFFKKKMIIWWLQAECRAKPVAVKVFMGQGRVNHQKWLNYIDEIQIMA